MILLNYPKKGRIC